MATCFRAFSGILLLVKNFGIVKNFILKFIICPLANVDKSVLELVRNLSTYWSSDSLKDYYSIKEEIMFGESKLLKLNCDKALSDLGWIANLDFEKTAEFVGKYHDYYISKKCSGINYKQY